MATRMKDRAVANGVPSTVESHPATRSDWDRQAVPHRPTVEERAARGRAAREKTPRSSHAYWVEAPDRGDPIALLESQATTRLPDLIPIRYARMRVSPFTFLRGSAIVMAHDLARTPSTGVRTQLCGDCHLSNFGVYASPERTLLFDINDFDETLPGPWEWDVKRLVASFHVAGRSNGFSEAECREAVLAAVRSYRLHMAEFAALRTLDVWYSRVTADDLLNLIAGATGKAGAVMRKRAEQQLGKTRQRDSLQALSKLTEMVDGRLVIANDPPLVTRVTEDQMGTGVRSLFDLYMRSLRSSQCQVLERFEVVDVAIKVVGVGSVGTRCFIVLMTGRDSADPLFLQVKEAEASVLAGHLTKSIYKHQGERVVAGQELMQAASDIFLGWMSGPTGRYFYVRQLRDMKGSVEVETMQPSGFLLYGDLCGWALARAHARAGDPVEIAAYLGASDSFDRALASFAEAYANQTERDYKAFVAAIKSGRIKAASAG
jgi:uncharacterized protein (DUF2252 family)